LIDAGVGSNVICEYEQSRAGLQIVSRGVSRSPLAVELVSVLTRLISHVTALADDPYRIAVRAAHELFREVATAESAEPRLWGMTEDYRVAVPVSRQQKNLVCGLAPQKALGGFSRIDNDGELSGV
jgi:hypothetical protein